MGHLCTKTSAILTEFGCGYTDAVRLVLRCMSITSEHVCVGVDSSRNIAVFLTELRHQKGNAERS